MMTAGEAEFDAEGVGLLASAGEATGLCVVAEALTTSIRSPLAGSAGGDDDTNTRG
jgi:hypothetical protein